LEKSVPDNIPIRLKRTQYRPSRQAGFDFTLVFRVSEDLYISFFGKNHVGYYEFLKAFYPFIANSYPTFPVGQLAIYATGRLGGVPIFLSEISVSIQFQDLIPVGGYPFSDNVYI